MTKLSLHLVSDSTGETVGLIAKAVIVQFKELDAEEFAWPMTRSPAQIEELMTAIRENPGFVLYTVVDQDVRRQLEDGCRELGVPCLSVMQPIIDAMKSYLGQDTDARPGRQHTLDDEYFNRINAMDYVLSHDDGQSDRDLEDADVILVGVSRTSKTPTCIYLGNRGIKAANFPIVPGTDLPSELFEVRRPLIVGLTKDPRRLVEVRRQRLRLLNQDDDTDYVDADLVAQEINDARRLFSRHDWPVINVSRRSIEETATTIMQLLKRRGRDGDAHG
ncbi:MAG: pyruvate, water dikinase regulatory protein [Rhodospirillales bacterium]